LSTIPRRSGAFHHRERVQLTLMSSALTCALLSIVFGAIGALSYVPVLGERMARAGLTLVQLRPLHSTFASAWIFVGATACVFKFLHDEFGEPSAAERNRLRAQLVCWGLAGLGALFTLPFGITTGREYLGFHPAISALIATGWILFAWTFFARVRRGFWHRPVYVYMWAVGIAYFLWTFAEGHAWLLSFVRDRPVSDLQIQWKSCGTLVAAFNQMVYGSLLYVAERRSGDRTIAQSRAAFALLGIGVLNSFTNYAHHTYHLPQSHLVKWIAFAVSMLEIIILVDVLRAVTASPTRPRRFHDAGPDLTARFFTATKRWNLGLLSLALLISVPPLNALIHGTHVVMAHAMGSELAIDSFILLGAFAALLGDIFPKRETREGLIEGEFGRRFFSWLNAALAVLVVLLVARGLATGITRYAGLPEPGWVAAFPAVFVTAGFAVGLLLLRLIVQWAPLFTRSAEHKRWRDDYGETPTGLGRGPTFHQRLDRSNEAPVELTDRNRGNRTPRGKARVLKRP
jgi:nitric oxide reductase subunit B